MLAEKYWYSHNKYIVIFINNAYNDMFASLMPAVCSVTDTTNYLGQIDRDNKNYVTRYSDNWFMKKT